MKGWITLKVNSTLEHDKKFWFPKGKKSNASCLSCVLPTRIWQSQSHFVTFLFLKHFTCFHLNLKSLKNVKGSNKTSGGLLWHLLIVTQSFYQVENICTKIICGPFTGNMTKNEVNDHLFHFRSGVCRHSLIR